MKDSFMMLCSFVVACGLIRCFIAGTSLEKHFSMVSGIILLLILIGGIKGLDLPDLNLSSDNSVHARSDYDELVILKASEIIEGNISTALSSRYGVQCKAKVDLEQTESTYLIKSVMISGIDEVGYIKLYLADYLSVEEDVIDFA